MRVIKIGRDGHILKVFGDDSSATMNYNSAESFSMAAGAIRLARHETADLPSDLQGLVAYDTDDDEPKYNDGSGWETFGGTAITYATGTWTANVQDTSLSDGEGQAVTSTNTKYTRIGDMVYFSGEISITNKGTLSGSLVYISGLPLTADSDGGH